MAPQVRIGKLAATADSKNTDTALDGNGEGEGGDDSPIANDGDKVENAEPSAEAATLKYPDPPKGQVALRSSMRLRCPFSEVHFSPNELVFIKKADLSNWIKSQMSVGIIEQVAESDDDEIQPAIRTAKAD